MHPELIVTENDDVTVQEQYAVQAHLRCIDQRSILAAKITNSDAVIVTQYGAMMPTYELAFDTDVAVHLASNNACSAPDGKDGTGATSGQEFQIWFEFYARLGMSVVHRVCVVLRIRTRLDRVPYTDVICRIPSIRSRRKFRRDFIKSSDRAAANDSDPNLDRGFSG